MYGRLVPLDGGGIIPLTRKNLVVGRRESSCNIVLPFPDVSGRHCQLRIVMEYRGREASFRWRVRDLGSRNGTKVNQKRITDSPLESGDILTIAAHSYRITYSLTEAASTGLSACGMPEVHSGHSSILRRASRINWID